MMKENFFILFFILLSNNIIYGQTRPDLIIVDYTSYNKPLKVVLQDLSSITKVNLVYADTKLPMDNPIKVQAKSQTLGSILNYILNPLSYKYKLIGNQLVIIKQGSVLDQDFILSGYIKDKLSSEPLIGANIFNIDKSKGTSSNEQGFFTLKLPSETQRLVITYLGYSSQSIDITLTKDSTAMFFLQPDLKLNEVLITDKKADLDQEQTINKQKVNVEILRNSNNFGGETDLFRYLSTLPGVSSAADGISGINVRGSGADNNLILLDGTPMYNTGHGLGIFSTINTSIIKNADFYKGNMPARYSGRLASVLDLHTKQGNSKKISGEASISLIAFKTSLEGPISKDKGSFLISYRRTFVDIWLKEITQWLNRELDRNGEANYFFSDIYAKANYQLSARHKIDLSYFRSKDNFLNSNQRSGDGFLLDQTENNVEWGNDLSAFKLTSVLTNKLFGRCIIYQTSYDQNSFRYNAYNNINTPNTLDYIDAYLFKSNIKEKSIKYELDWLPSVSHFVKGGIAVTDRSFSPKVLDADEKSLPENLDKVTPLHLDTLGQNASIKSMEYNLYIEDDIRFSQNSHINIGINYAFFNDATYNFKAFQPRFSFYTGSETTAFKVGIGRTIQYLHLVSSSGLGLYNDVWLPSQNKVPPQSAWLADITFKVKTKSGFQIGAEAYYKILENLSNFQEGKTTNISEGVDWESELAIGNGKAYGFEFYIEKSIGKFIGNISYTYSKSKRDFELLNKGNTFPFTYNREHSVKANLIYKISAFSEFTASWNGLSGTYYSKPLSYTFDTENGPEIIFTDRNNAQFDPYYRLDIGFALYNTYKWGGRTKLFMGIYNVLNNKNFFYADIERDSVDINKFSLQYYRLLPFMPSISFSVVW
ncbi:MAG: TonB-dependent receptor [Saprospiraceae bacterium]